MRHLPPCVFSHHLPTCKTFVFVIVLSACVWDLWYDNKSCKNRCSLLIVQFLPSLSQSQESAALCCCYCVCSSVHEPLGLTDTAQSDILRLTPLITEVYMQIHDADSHKTARGNKKQVFFRRENDKRLSEICCDHIYSEKLNVENKRSVWNVLLGFLFFVHVRMSVVSHYFKVHSCFNQCSKIVSVGKM